MAHHPIEQTHAGERSRRMWPTIWTAVVGIALLIFIARACGVHHEPKHTEPIVEVPKANLQAPSVRESIRVKLPTGLEIDAYKGGIEDQLVAFLLDGGSLAGKDIWFDFNDLNFKFGTAEIIPESRKEVDNIAQILKAFPAARIKIGGYTDKVGDEAANKKISQERADAVLESLRNLGVGSQVEGAEGYGSAFAKVPADAPEAERIKDRRVSVSVRAK